MRQLLEVGGLAEYLQSSPQTVGVGFSRRSG